LELNVALHLGTLLSILWVYRADLITLPRRPRLCGLMILATLPLVIVGLTLKDWVAAELQTPFVAGLGLLVTAAVLFLARRLERDEIPLERFSWGGALLVGLFQAVAIAPGVSRSGSTIAAGLLMGLRRDAAARFSFLIAIPAISGAAILIGLGQFGDEPGGHPLPVLLTGAATSFVVGLIVLRWLIGVIVRGRLHWFAWYCGALGAATVIWQVAQG
ncbi:MAG: undecaprenyl-diphosphate phosphatase, partial [Planctomycetaceae bacterium]